MRIEAQQVMPDLIAGLILAHTDAALHLRAPLIRPIVAPCRCPYPRTLQGDNLGLGEGEIKTVDLAPGLEELHEGLELV